VYPQANKENALIFAQLHFLTNPKQKTMTGSQQVPFLQSPFAFWNYVIFPLHIAYRIYVANRMPIMDCDETFNYWEVVHFLLFRENSFQTWEYANEFALRTYAYLTPIVGLGRLYLKILESGILPSWLWPILTDQVFDPSKSTKIALFCLLRSTLGAATAYAEVSFCRAIIEQGYPLCDATKNGEERSKDDKVKDTISNSESSSVYTPLWFALLGWVTECLLISSAGMAHSAAALLPSTTLTGFWLLAAAAYLRKQHVCFCFLAITATLAIGWPFGVLVFVPLGLGVLFREQKQIMAFIFLRIVPITIVVQGLVMLVDYHFYGRLVSPSLNILVYNTQAGGDELYGVEPLSYYIKNLLLNFNYVAIAGAIGVLPLFWHAFSSSSWVEGWILMAPLYIWVGIVFPRPHKEERFLFPIYPCLCLGAGILSVSFVKGISSQLRSRLQQHQKDSEQKLTRSVRLSAFILALIWIPAASISLSRTIALSKYYTAPLHLYSHLSSAIATREEMLDHGNQTSDEMSAKVVCTGGEWYRFPSSFYIQSDVFGFAPSTFRGQLPQPFSEEGSGPPTSTSNQFNDKNQPEDGSYMPFERCDYLIELSTSLHSCTGQSGDDNENTKWNPIARQPFFDAEATTSTIHRVIYIPHLHDNAVESGKVRYIDYVLYAR